MQVGEDAEDIDVGAQKQELMQLADEYSRLDAEDIVGGVRTRFRYREVPSLCMQSCIHEHGPGSEMLAQPLETEAMRAHLTPVASQASSTCLPWLLVAGA